MESVAASMKVGGHAVLMPRLARRLRNDEHLISCIACTATCVRRNYEIRDILGAGYRSDVRVGRRIRDVPRRRSANSFAFTFRDDFSGDSFVQSVEILAKSGV
jgi:hypothetical protein